MARIEINIQKGGEDLTRDQVQRARMSSAEECPTTKVKTLNEGREDAKRRNGESLNSKEGSSCRSASAAFCIARSSVEQEQAQKERTKAQKGVRNIKEIKTNLPSQASQGWGGTRPLRKNPRRRLKKKGARGSRRRGNDTEKLSRKEGQYFCPGTAFFFYSELR